MSRQVAQLLLEGAEPVRAMVRRDDDRAAQLRALGADVVVGDLTRAGDIADAIEGVDRMFFNMGVSPDYLRATAEVCAVALERGDLDAIVNISQMTVSQMTLTSTDESHQHRLHWLAEHVMNWSGLPVIHVRPTAFLDNPLFTSLAARSVRERGVLELPFGTGRTSPIASADVARVVATLLRDPNGRTGEVYELTGPEVLAINGLAERSGRALSRAGAGRDVPLDDWTDTVLRPLGIADTTFYRDEMGQKPGAVCVERDPQTKTLAVVPIPVPAQPPLLSLGSGLYMTAADHAKVLRSLLQSSAGEGGLLKKETVDEMFRPQLKESQRAVLQAVTDAHHDSMVPELSKGMPLDHGIGGVINLEDEPGKRRAKGIDDLWRTWRLLARSSGGRSSGVDTPKNNSQEQGMSWSVANRIGGSCGTMCC